MKTGALCLAALVVAVAVWAFSRSADAHPGPTAVPDSGAPASPPVGFKLNSSKGYQVAVYALAGKEGSSLIVLVEGKGASAAYITPVSETLPAGSIKADLGELGRIAVAFHPTGGTRTQRSACGGRSVSFLSGYYEGTIAFHGEEGFTAVEASRANGDDRFPLDLICPATGESGVGPGLPGAKLKVRGKRTSATRSLTAIKNDPRAQVQLEALLSEHRGEMAIERSVRIKAPQRAFRFDHQLDAASLSPPAPFSGRAAFRRLGRHGSKWAGDLKVDFPGEAGVPLTGTGFRAALFRARFKGTGPLE